MKTVYCTIRRQGPGDYEVRFWTDESNALTERFVKCDLQAIRDRITMVTGLKRFHLEIERG